jgi:hypothetical protein
MPNTEAFSPRERRSQLDLMEAEDDRLGRGVAGDRAFFEDHPNREYRARLATPYEVARHDEMNPNALAAPPGDLFLWVVVHQIIPGMRMRRFGYGLPPRADIDEATARDLFLQFSNGEGD